MRLFVGFVPPEPALDALERAVATAAAPPGALRWTPRAGWHVTLAFLGEVAPALVEPLGAALTAAADRPAPVLRLAGSGVFPAAGRPSVLWAGLTGDLDALHQLAVGVRRAVAAAAAPAAGAEFAAHLTLGRWPRAGRSGPDLQVGTQRAMSLPEIPPGPRFTVEEIRLVRSHLGAAARHETLATVRVTG